MEPLSPAAVRALGALMEKAMTTPEYYPLTLNALVAACNQKSNREPVTHYSPDECEKAHDELRTRRLGHKLMGGDSRVAKFNQTARETLGLDTPQAALLCTLLLRGPQTPGELRQRTGRMCEFDDLGAVEAALEVLTRREPEPLAVRLPRREGSREARYMHLLGGQAAVEDFIASADAPDDEAAPAENTGRIEALESELEDLRSRVEKLEGVIRELTGE